LSNSAISVHIPCDRRISRWLRAMTAMCLLAGAVSGLSGQNGLATGKQVAANPATASQILSSYEGQNVTAVEVAGRPQSAVSEFEPLFLQEPGEPFSIDKVNGTLAALKSSGKAKDVRVQVDAEASGVRVQFILEPAVYFGIFEFPGAERFSYARLVQVANFQAQMPCKRLRRAVLTRVGDGRDCGRSCPHIASGHDLCEELALYVAEGSLISSA